MIKKKLPKYRGREARQPRISKVGQTWGSEFTLASRIATKEEVRIIIGPGRCSECQTRGVIAYNEDSIPICLNCGLSYEPRLRDHIPKEPPNRLKSAERFLKKMR